MDTADDDAIQIFREVRRAAGSLFRALNAGGGRTCGDRVVLQQ